MGQYFVQQPCWRTDKDTLFEYERVMILGARLPSTFHFSIR